MSSLKEKEPNMLELRTYQRETVEGLYQWFEKHDTGNPLVVVPTAGGKSLISAKIDEDALQWPNQRILNLTHVQELVEQNYHALYKLWPEAPSGIYCAGLKKKQSHHPITFASIQSVYKKVNEIGWRDLVKIDEAHLLGDSDSSMYRSFLAGLKSINPKMRVVGFSATPYRLKSGYLHRGEGALFSDIAYEIPITRLVKEGFLAPLVSKGAVTQGNTDKLAIQAGEFAMREAITEFDRKEMTQAAVQEMMTCGIDRRAWLIFCVSIDHATHLRDALRESGVTAEMICDKTTSDERRQILNNFKAGNIRAVTNVSVLTTGFDAPNIDMIVLLRPTMSPGLLVQMCGRGMRLFPGKENCLVLDMASNLERHGPVTHIRPPEGSRKHKLDRDGKLCPRCRSVCQIDDLECPDCGHIFEGQPRKIKHAMRASRADAMSNEPRLSETLNWFRVLRTTYELHMKPGSAPTVRVTYKIPHGSVSEWICPGHTGYAKEKADQWWIARGGRQPVPSTAVSALERAKELSGFRASRIRAHLDGKWPRIKAYDLVPATGEMLGEYGNLGGRITQEPPDATTTQAV